MNIEKQIVKIIKQLQEEKALTDKRVKQLYDLISGASDELVKVATGGTPDYLNENYFERDAENHIRIKQDTLLSGVDADKLDGKQASEFALVTQEDWIAPTLLNSWVNYGATFPPAGYFKDNFGIVHLRGLIKDGIIGSPAFVLPEGYRSINHLHFSVPSNNAYGDCFINSNGSVTPTIGNNTWFSLTGIAFSITT